MESISKKRTLNDCLVAVIIFGCLVFVENIFAASFDCNRAVTAGEKMVCQDGELSKLDEKLYIVYSELTKTTFDLEGLKLEQHKWLEGRDKIASGIFEYPDPLSVVRHYYKGRIDRLTERLSLPVLTAEQRDAAEADPWHCDLMPTRLTRQQCIKERDIEPFKYEIELGKQSKGFTLCELMLKNLTEQIEPPNV